MNRLLRVIKIWGAALGAGLCLSGAVWAGENDAGGAVPPKGYRVVDLGPGTVVWDMNASGLCVGTRGGTGEIWRVNAAGIAVEKQFEVGFVPTAVSTGGDVIGNVGNAFGLCYRADEGYVSPVRVSPPGGARAMELWACSDRVGAAGVRRMADGQRVACAWAPGGRDELVMGFTAWTNAVRSSSLSSVAYAVNDRGWVAGMSYGRRGERLLRECPVVWIPGTELGRDTDELMEVPLPWPDFIKAFEDTARLAPYALNNGTVEGGATSVWAVGYFDFARVSDYDDKFLPVLWKVTIKDGEALASVSSLGNALKFAGANTNWAPKGYAARMGSVYMDVNDAGVIVGYSVRRGDGNGRSTETARRPVAGLEGFAFVRDAAGYQDLNDLIGPAGVQWDLRQAMRVNNAGWVAVNAVHRGIETDPLGRRREMARAAACILIPVK